MRVIINCERRLDRTPDGVVWTTSSDAYSFWQRYLAVFDEVVVVCRLRNVSKAEANWKPVTGSGVSVLGLPDYLGPLGFLKTNIVVLSRLMKEMHRKEAIILRIPSHVATSMEIALRIRQQPYGAEVVGDIGAALAPGSVDHLLRPLLRLVGIRTVRRQCWNACAIAYVTTKVLQHGYPPSPQAFTTDYSSIELSDESIMINRRDVKRPRINVVSVGSMAKKYKRFDILIGAVEKCLKEGFDLRLTLIGDGHYRAFFENIASSLGDRVEFLGELPSSDAVREQLLKSDLFVLPSINEGLPRVIIEAMAVGLPCIGTTVGGTSELLPPDDMVPPSDMEALTTKIREVVSNPERMNAMSARNLEAAKRYANSELTKRRKAMYCYLREYTERWIQNK